MELDFILKLLKELKLVEFGQGLTLLFIGYSLLKGKIKSHEDKLDRLANSIENLTKEVGHLQDGQSNLIRRIERLEKP